MIAFFKDGIERKLLLWLGVAAVIFVIAGVGLSAYLNTVLLEIVLACCLVIMSLVLLVVKNLVVKPTAVSSVAGGGRYYCRAAGHGRWNTVYYNGGV